MVKPLLIALIVGAVLGFGGGWITRGDHENAIRLQAVRAGIQKTQEGRAKTDAIAVNQATAQAAQAIKDRIIEREVIRYVEVTPAADRCILPGTWRVRHDAAASGEPAEPSTLASGQADPVSDAAALETISENYTECRSAIAQVVGWQEWWATAKNYCGPVYE